MATETAAQKKKAAEEAAAAEAAGNGSVSEETAVAEGWEPTGAAAKLAYIQTHIRNVEKTGRNEHHKYNYFQEHGLLDLLRPMLRTLHCAIVPSPTGISYSREGNRAIVTGYLDFIDTDQSPHYTTSDGKPVVSSVSGEPIENPAYRVRAFFTNEGVDQQDKATNKALTGWMKYALQKLFAVPTEQVDDADHSDVRAAAQATAGAPAPRKIHPDYANGYANGALKDAVESGALTKAQVVAKLATFRATAPTDLDTEQFAELEAWVQAAVDAQGGQP